MTKSFSFWRLGVNCKRSGENVQHSGLTAEEGQQKKRGKRIYSHRDSESPGDSKTKAAWGKGRNVARTRSWDTKIHLWGQVRNKERGMQKEPSIIYSQERNHKLAGRAQGDQSG